MKSCCNANFAYVDMNTILSKQGIDIYFNSRHDTLHMVALLCHKQEIAL